MKYLILILFSVMVMADTPPPNTVKAKMFTGDGVTSITATGSSLNTNLTNSSLAVTGTFFQATQPVSLLALPALATGANTIGAVNINGTVPISGTITATNSANGATGSTVPAQATLVGGTDGTNLRALKVSGTGVLSVDGSAVTQPISAAALPLPTGAATAAGLTTINTTLGTPFQAGGSIGNTAFGISGTLPAFAATPTFNLGTLNGAATATNQSTMITSLSTIATNTPALGQALSAGSSPVVLPAAQITALTPPTSVTVTQATAANLNATVTGTVTANAGTGTFAISAAALPLPTGAATAAGLTTINTTLGTPFQAGGSVGNTSFGATQATAANLNATVVGPSGVALAKDSSLTTINTTLGTPMQNTGGTVTANAGTGTFAISAGALPLPTGASTSANQSTEISSLATIATNTTNAGTPTVSGTVTANQGSAGATAWKVDGSAVTQPVSAASLPLPTGAATSANQTSQITQETSTATNTANIPAKGLAGVAGSTPVALPNATTLTTTAFSSVTGVLNTDMLTGSASGWFDVSGYNSFYTDIYTTTTVTGGVITFEQTNDTTNDAAGITLNLQDSTVLTQTNVTSLTLAASTIKHYQAPITSRYIRFRISTAFAGTGTVGATVNFRQTPYIPITTPVSQATAASLATTATIASGTVTTVSTVSSVTSDNLAIPGIVADVASAAITTTTTTATLTPTAGVGYKVTIPVTVVSGTTPTMVVGVQESGDTGTDWVTVYTFPTITTTGYYESPPLFFKGNRVRYVQTITGTTPSFTRAINRLQMSAVAATPVNNNATFASATVSSSCSTLTAPVNAVAFILENLSSNTVNMFWTIGSTAATSTTGMLLEPGRDTGEVHAGQNISLCSASGTPTYSLQWIQQ